MEQPPQRIAILGSTGSIGRQTLDIVRAHPERFVVEMLAACNNWVLLAAQAREFLPDTVVIANEQHYPALQKALGDLPVKVYCGPEAIEQAVACSSVDTVVSALVGFAGLAPTLAAIRAGKKIALANKETLVAAGSLVISESGRCGAPILPVDSEHSAIFQCLVGERTPPRRVILTASGGALRSVPVAGLPGVTPEQALRHPNWAMGPRVTIDSATMMNKGFEAIEALWLFGLTPGQIDVALHPQSIVHSLVEFADGSLKAQLGAPDMRLPIQYALTFPERCEASGVAPCDLFACGPLTFEEPPAERYPCLALAYEAMRTSGSAPCVLNAADEVAVTAFLEKRIGFTRIGEVVAGTLSAIPYSAPASLEEFAAVDAEARRVALRFIDRP